MGTARRRIFFALWPDAEAIEGLRLQAGQLHAISGGRLMRPETLHLTLCFLGDVEAARVADAIAAVERAGPLPAFRFDLDQTDRFERAHVLWAGASRWPAALGALAEALAGAMRKAGFPIEARPFIPHVTLVRDPVEAVPEGLWSPVPWEAREFVLVESVRRPAAAHYEVLARWPLLPS